VYRRILFCKPENRKHFGNPGTEEKIKLKWFLRKQILHPDVEWINLALDIDHWRVLVNTNIQVP